MITIAVVYNKEDRTNNPFVHVGKKYVCTQLNCMQLFHFFYEFALCGGGVTQDDDDHEVIWKWKHQFDIVAIVEQFKLLVLRPFCVYICLVYTTHMQIV